MKTKFEQKQKQKDVDNIVKDKDAGEVFVMTSSPEEIKNVMSLNDPLTRSQINKCTNY